MKKKNCPFSFLVVLVPFTIPLLLAAFLLADPLRLLASDLATTQQSSQRASLTPAEQKEWNQARAQALQDPAVQSTRRITRMALHKAMLQANPSIETIFANMNSHVPKNAIPIAHEEKSSGVDFDQWLHNYLPESRAALTQQDLIALKNAHEKALCDPSVRAARKTARITFYNALMNVDPELEPILIKEGIKTPNSIATPRSHSSLGSEERILGGNADTWDTDVLVPLIEKKPLSTPAASK